MRCIIPYLIHHFDFKLAEPTRTLAMDPATEHQLGFEMLGILKPREGLWLHALPRNLAGATCNSCEFCFPSHGTLGCGGDERGCCS